MEPQRQPSWREQRKALIATNDNETRRFPSLWMAAKQMARHYPGTEETARKQIKRGIKSGGMRYGYRWHWEEE